MAQYWQPDRIPANDDYALTLNGIAGQYAAIRLDALRHESMTKGGIARSDSGNFVLTDFSIEHIAADGNKTKLPIAAAEATYEQGSLVVANTFDDDPRTGWAVYAGKPIDQDHAAVFHFKQPVAVDANDRLRIVLKHQSVHRQHNLGHFRIRLSQNPSATLESESEKLTEALRTPVDSRDAKQREFIAKAYFESDSDYRSALAEEQGVRSQIDAITKRAPKVMIMGDRPERRSTFILERGLYNKPGPQVTAQFPKFLPSPNSATDRELKRLDLANWIVSDDNPLTARVIANRFWQQFFGIGLVKTTEDFGRQGERPEHLDLLNWLAFEFREQNWNVKHLIKTIVMSHTYRQSSRLPDPKLQALDPNNRLLARAARFRMPSWMLRDQALASSGLLSESAGGPAVNSYQPEGIWEEASFGKKKYRQDEGEKLYRRSLYIFWRRIIAPTMFFDAATRQTCTVKSSRTNTPLHALQTLNNTLYVEAARNLAEVALNSAAAEPRERLNVAFERVLARPANEAERRLFLDAVIRSQEEYAESRDAAEALLQVGESPFDSHLDTAELAAWTNLCLAIFNLDEALNRE